MKSATNKNLLSLIKKKEFTLKFPTRIGTYMKKVEEHNRLNVAITTTKKKTLVWMQIITLRFIIFEEF